MKILFSTLNSKYIHSNLGIYSVAAYLAKQQLAVQVEIKEYTIQTPILSMLADIYMYQPDIIALATYIWNRQETLALTKAIKKVLPKTMIILGGPEVSFAAAEVFLINPEIDYIVQGEGEQVFAQLIGNLLKKETILPAGISRKNAISETIAIIEELDELPFVYKQLDIALENKIIYYESTRGCPFSCTYCLSGITHNVRKRSLKLVLAELQFFIENKVKQVKFVDRTYNLDLNHYLPIMEYLANQETTTNFHFEIKADLLSKEVLEFLATVPVGRFQFEIGIQTTNPQTLSAIKRQDNWQNLQGNIKQLVALKNIHIHVDLIAGLPYEDLASFKNSFNMVYNLQADAVQLGFLKILSGSLLARQQQEHGYNYLSQPPYEVLSNKYISYAELRMLKLVEDMLDRFHNSNKYNNTLQYLIVEFYDKDAFKFYEELALYAEACKLHLQSSGSKQNLELFINFIDKKFNINQARLIKEILHLDVFRAQEGWRREFFYCQSEQTEFNEAFLKFWRDIDLVKKYIANYQFTNWRQIKKLYPMESFRFAEQERIYLLLAEQGQLIEVAKEDFYENI